MESVCDSLWIKVNNPLPLWSLRSERFNQDSLGTGIHTESTLVFRQTASKMLWCCRALPPLPNSPTHWELLRTSVENSTVCHWEGEGV